MEELLDWQVLEAIDPYGQRRLDILFARLAKSLMDSVGGKKPNGEPFSTVDFLLEFKVEEDKPKNKRRRLPKKQTLKVQEALLTDWVMASNAAFAERVNSG